MTEISSCVRVVLASLAFPKLRTRNLNSVDLCWLQLPIPNENLKMSFHQKLLRQKQGYCRAGPDTCTFPIDRRASTNKSWFRQTLFIDNLPTFHISHHLKKTCT